MDAGEAIMASMYNVTSSSNETSALLGNVTWSSPGDGDLLRTLELLKTLVAVTGVADLLVGLALNAFLLLLILTSPTLRRDVRNQLIVNVSVGDLLVTGVFAPLTVQRALSEWRPRCAQHLAEQLFFFFALSFVSAWGLVTLDALVLARALQPALPAAATAAVSPPAPGTCKRRLRRALAPVALLLPWVTAALVTAPLLVSGLHDLTRVLWSPRNCPIILNESARLAYTLLFFFLPCLFAFVFLGLAAACRRYGVPGRRRGRGLPPPPSPLTLTDLSAGRSREDPPAAYLAASLVTFLLLGPLHVWVLLQRHGRVLTDVPTVLWVSLVLQWLGEAKSAYLPLVWITLLPDLRQTARCRLAALWAAVRGGATGSEEDGGGHSFDPSVTYSNLEG